MARALQWYRHAVMDHCTLESEKTLHCLASIVRIHSIGRSYHSCAISSVSNGREDPEATNFNVPRMPRIQKSKALAAPAMEGPFDPWFPIVEGEYGIICGSRYSHAIWTFRSVSCQDCQEIAAGIAYTAAYGEGHGNTA